VLNYLFFMMSYMLGARSSTITSKWNFRFAPNDKSSGESKGVSIPTQPCPEP
jgi:hypothetical protein